MGVYFGVGNVFKAGVTKASIQYGRTEARKGEGGSRLVLADMICNKEIEAGAKTE